MRSFLLGKGRPEHVQRDSVIRSCKSAKHDVEAFRRRVATERDQLQLSVVAGGRACELGQVDPVPDRAQLARRERERARVDGRDRGRD